MEKLERSGGRPDTRAIPGLATGGGDGSITKSSLKLPMKRLVLGKRTSRLCSPFRVNVARKTFVVGEGWAHCKSLARTWGSFEEGVKPGTRHTRPAEKNTNTHLISCAHFPTFK